MTLYQLGLKIHILILKIFCALLSLFDNGHPNKK